jgi:MYXO-CTERM domain-containing protein
MRTKLAFVMAFAVVCSVSALATTMSYGWEDGGTIMGQFPANTLDAANVTDPDPVHGDSYSLKLTKLATGTLQAYVAWVRGLQDGDLVTGSFWVYDTTPTTNPSGRIWAHWNDDPNDVMGFNTSASGSTTYSGTDPWSQLSYSWTVSGGHTGLVIETRVYGAIADSIWVDDIDVTVPDHATVTFAPEPAGLALLSLGLVCLHRRR